MHYKLLFFLFFSTFLALMVSSQEVKLYQEKISIPTYQIGEAEKNPIFYQPKPYQGAQGRVYPYPNLNQLTDQKVMKDYNGVILENEFVKICVLPEIGGRIYYAKDKSNGYDYVYYNEVIKPALIGMTGAWMSGGVEWNIPHHHRASTFMPVDYKLQDNLDGSKTVWVGEYEKRNRSKWMVGLTLRPGKSYLEVSIKYFNVTPLVQSLLFWANIAVNANESYQVIYPPDVEKVVYHAKVDFSDWPISHQKYMGVDFTKGVDLSWWKNAPDPTSFFVWESKMDFVAGYDHGKNAGIVIVGDRHTVTGKKFWNWGNNEVQRMWDQILTDKNGPYLELMVGAYSDSQPDYSWCNPYCTQEATMYYYPVQHVKNIKNANKDIAVNLEINEGKVTLEVGATSICDNLKMILSDDGKNLYEKNISITPSKTFHLDTTLNISDPEKLTLRVLTFDGKELISYQPTKRKNEPTPEIYHTPKEPKEIQSVEELYLTGLRIEQFHNANFNPMVYYQEALRRDSANMLVNNQLGIYYLRNYNFETAEKHLRIAINRASANYTKPKFSEPMYYMGLCLLEQGKYDESYDWFAKAAWSIEWESASYFKMAQISALKGDYSKALENCNHAVVVNGKNNDALGLKSALLRTTGDYPAALQNIKSLLKLNPTDFFGLYELYKISNKVSAGKKTEVLLAEFQNIIRDEPDNFLETAARFGAAGFYTDAVNILLNATHSTSKKVNANPMIAYYLGYYYNLLNDKDNSIKYLKLAGSLPVDYCFPYGTTSILVLKTVCEKIPTDGLAHYYLGNIYCDFQPDVAEKEWEKAAQLNTSTAVIYRNLAYVYANFNNNLQKAIENIDKAIALNPNDALFIAEADNYYTYAKLPIDKRIKLFTNNPKAFEKVDITLAHWVNLLIYTGKYDEAIKILTDFHFHNVEAFDGGVHLSLVDAHVLRGKQLLQQKQYQKALDHFAIALTFPRNLEYARDSKSPIAYYYMGLAYQGLNNKPKAEEYFKKSSETDDNEWGEVLNSKALALKEQGQNDMVKKTYLKMMDKGYELLKEKSEVSHYSGWAENRYNEVRRKAKGYYFIALAKKGLGLEAEATDYFKKSGDTDPYFLSQKAYRQ